MRLYRAICAWLEAQAQPAERNEPQREGNNFSHIEHGEDMPTFPEMHIGYRPQSIDDDNGGTYRAAQPISLRWTPTSFIPSGDGTYKVPAMRRGPITNRYETNDD